MIMNKEKNKIWIMLFLFVVLIIAGWIRFYNLGRLSLWLDEAMVVI